MRGASTSVSAIAGADPGEVERCVEGILASAEPSDALLAALAKEEARPAVAVAIYESVAPRIRIVHYWTYYRASRAYLLLGRDDACYASAVAAIQMEPDYPHWHMFENIYRYFRARGRFREAVEIARVQIAHTPDIPIISPAELAHVARQAGMQSDEEAEPGVDRTRHALYAESTFRLGSHSRYGIHGQDTKAAALDTFMHDQTRPAVTVWEIASAEIIVFDRSILIFDAERNLQADISVCEFPGSLANKATDVATYAGLPVQDVNDVIVIGDRFATANLCHFLLDHVTRLALYDAICSVGEALVIGPSLVTDYQRRIVDRLGIASYQGTSERCIIRAKRLLVSETCKRTFVHPAHLGAKWALSYLKDRLVFSLDGRRADGRIYISRRDASVRFIRNEEVILSKLQAYGFEEVILSRYDYDEQLAFFARATHIVGMHGAGLTNIVFCPPGAHILEVCHPVSGTGAYAVTASTLDIHYAAMIGRDADSDEPMHNDAAAAVLQLGMGGAQVLSNRDVVVDLDELDRWLRDSGAAS